LKPLATDNFVQLSGHAINSQNADLNLRKNNEIFSRKRFALISRTQKRKLRSFDIFLGRTERNCTRIYILAGRLTGRGLQPWAIENINQRIEI
jgi:hypothetical protein